MHWSGFAPVHFVCYIECIATASGATGPARDMITKLATKTVEKPRTKVKPKTERPPLYKVILLNDDYTPREFVVQVLEAVFRTSEDEAYHIMVTAHRKGACVVAVFTKDIAETKATQANDMGKAAGFPLMFTTEPEE